jgi:hypothetical protein
VADGLLPPFGAPSGPPADDDSVVRAFLRGEPAGHSERFHVEGPVLVAAADRAVAIRLGPTTALVRADLPPAFAPVKEMVERLFADEGMTALDHETLLATPVAVQLLGLRASTWDLWGADIDAAFAALRAAAVGEQPELRSEGPGPFEFGV